MPSPHTAVTRAAVPVAKEGAATLPELCAECVSRSGKRHQENTYIIATISGLKKMQEEDLRYPNGDKSC